MNRRTFSGINTPGTATNVPTKIYTLSGKFLGRVGTTFLVTGDNGKTYTFQKTPSMAMPKIDLEGKRVTVTYYLNTYGQIATKITVRRK